MPERTIDQRLDALTSSVELLASLYRDRERVFYDALREQRDSHRLIMSNLQSVGGALTLLASTADKLVQIAEDHERRISRVAYEPGAENAS
jgi:hypothetical protein